MRLKDDISIRENCRYCILIDTIHNLKRLRKQTFLEGIFQEEMRNRKHVQVVGVVCAVTLQRAEVICVPNFCSQFFENRPVALLPLVTDLTFQMISQVGGHAVVVEQRVIYVK